MVASNFETALKRTLVYEGGYSNDPRDPGGVTLQGVTQRVYDAYRDRENKKRQPLVRGMMNDSEWIAERNAIYRANYWLRVRGDELPIGVDAVVFDGAVNSGPGQSIKWLQRALQAQGGAVPADGQMGDITLAAVEYSENNPKLISEICGRRLAFLKSLKTWAYFGKGWAQRVAQVRAAGMAQAAASGAATVTMAPAVKTDAQEGSPKAPPASLPEPLVPPAVGTAGTTIGGAGSGAAQTLQDATTQLTPFADAIKWVKYVLIAITIVSLCLTFYALWKNYKNKKLESGDAYEEVPDPELEKV